MTLTQGTRLGPYEIGSGLGQGGMGEVYQARDVRLGRDVAIKLLSGRESAGPEGRARLMREARAIAALNHPNICALYDVGDHEGLAFLVMELVEGRTLANRLAGGPLPIDDVFDIAGQVAEAMRAAHERGVLHRDLKPSNIILGARGAKVLDFGLAMPVADGSPLDASTATAVETSGLAGTVHYMAPEQFRGQPATTASDVFAFGVLLHECITGRRPFEGATSAEVMASILMKQPPACLSPLGSVPAGLVDVVGRSLRKSPSDRWASFSELLSVLRTLEDAKRRPPARRPVARRLAVLPLEIAATADADQQYLSIGLTDALIASLSRVQSLTVLAGASGARFSRRTPLGEIRAKLDADLVVDGVLSREADRLRITVRLGDTRTGSHPWSHTSEHPLSEAVTQFGDIAASIADQIQLSLTVRQRRRLRIAQTVSPEAQEAYLRGCHERGKRTPEGMRRAFPYLKTALESAPTYALAHVAMGEWYLSASFMRLISAAEGLFRGRAAASEALRLDRTCADARVLLGMFAWFEWDRDTAVAEFARATALNPNLAVAYLAWSRCHLCIAQFDEAEERLGIAAKLDPLSPLVLRQLAAQSLCRGRYQEALRFGQETLQMNADDWHAPYFIGLAQHAIGDSAQALSTLRTAMEARQSHPSVVAALAFVMTETGDVEGGRRLIDRLRDRAMQAEVTPYDFAEYLAAVRNPDEALRYLERSYELRSPDLLGIKVDPIFAALRSDSRFQDLVRRVGLS